MVSRADRGGEWRGARLRSDRSRWSPDRRRCAHWSGSRRDARRGTWETVAGVPARADPTTLATSVARPREASATIVGRLVGDVHAAVRRPHCGLHDAEERSRIAGAPADSLEVVLGESCCAVDQLRWELSCRRPDDQSEKFFARRSNGFQPEARKASASRYRVWVAVPRVAWRAWPHARAPAVSAALAILSSLLAVVPPLRNPADARPISSPSARRIRLIRWAR
jgi:hypothetical protein